MRRTLSKLNTFTFWWIFGSALLVIHLFIPHGEDASKWSTGLHVLAYIVGVMALFQAVRLSERSVWKVRMEMAERARLRQVDRLQSELTLLRELSFTNAVSLPEGFVVMRDPWAAEEPETPLEATEDAPDYCPDCGRTSPLHFTHCTRMERASS